MERSTIKNNSEINFLIGNGMLLDFADELKKCQTTDNNANYTFITYNILLNKQNAIKTDLEIRNAYNDSLLNDIDEFNKQWKKACKFHPEIEIIFYELLDISAVLSESYRVRILKKKKFLSARKISYQLTNDYLKKLFGKNKELQQFGLGYLLDRNTEAVNELASTIKILNNSVNASEIKYHIISNHDLSSSAREDITKETPNEKSKTTNKKVKTTTDNNNNSSILLWILLAHVAMFLTFMILVLK